MKRILALLLCLSMLYNLTACGKSSSGRESALPPGSYPDYEASAEFNAVENATTSKEDWSATQWRLNCGAGASSSWFQAARYFNALMQESTKGKVKVDIRTANGYSNGDEVGSIQMLMYGDEFDLSMESGMTYSYFDPRFSVVSLPYLFSTTEEADSILGGKSAAPLKETLSQYGIYCLGIGENGFRQLTTTGKPVTSAGDLSGMTIRTGMSDLREESLRKLGCTPVPTTLAEAASALTAGTDGQEAPLALIQSEELGRGQKYVTLWNGSYDPMYFCLNQNVYSQLTDEQKKVVSGNAAKAIAYQKTINRRHAEALLEQWKEDESVEVISFEDVDTESFRNLLSGVEEWYLQELMNAVGMTEEEAGEFIEGFHPAEK